MALIDILKLNEELDKMIATQEKEIEQIKAEVEADFASQWSEMIRDLWALDDCAHNLGMEIGDIYAGTMEPEKTGRCYWDTLYYRFGDSCGNPVIYGKNYIGNICNEHNVYIGDKMNRQTMAMVKYWKVCKEKIHNSFEEECVNALKRKAEAANAKYQKAIELQKGVK